MKEVLPGAVVNSVVMGREYDKDIALLKEDKIFKQINERYKLDEEMINNGYRNGTAATQHGVNAEHIFAAEYNIKETRQALEQNHSPFYIEKSSEVNGPHDLIRGNEIYQAKYYKTAKGSLDACIEHIDKYPDDYKGNDNAYYVIPSDQHAIILAIKNGEVPDGVSSRTVAAIKRSITLFEDKKGASIEHALLSGEVTYKDSYVENNQAGNEERHREITQGHTHSQEKILATHMPSIAEGVFTVLLSAIVGAAFVITSQLFKGRKNKKGIVATLSFKEIAYTALTAGLTSAVIYGILSVIPANAILIGVLVAVLRTYVVSKYNQYKHKVDKLSFKLLLQSRIAELCSTGMGVYCVYLLLEFVCYKMIDKELITPQWVVVCSSITFSILGRIIMHKLQTTASIEHSRDIDELVSTASSHIRHAELECEYSISVIEEEQIQLAEYSKQISNRNIGFKARMNAISKINTLLKS